MMGLLGRERVYSLISFKKNEPKKEAETKVFIGYY